VASTRRQSPLSCTLPKVQHVTTALVFTRVILKRDLAGGQNRADVSKGKASEVNQNAGPSQVGRWSSRGSSWRSTLPTQYVDLRKTGACPF